MTKTYKYKSKIATAISFLAALIIYLGKDGLTQIMPEEYAFIIPILVFCAGYVLTQSTENKRVEIAEQLVYENITQKDDNVGPVTEDTGDENDVC